MTRTEILQTAKPILFNTDMVRAILDGRKTVTRRVIKPQPIHKGSFWELGGAGWSVNIRVIHPIPYHSLYNRMPYKPGDIMYARETYKRNMDGYSGIDFGGYIYKADCRSNFKDSYNPWRPSIHMPKKAARIFLRVADMRVEKLQDMSYIDSLKEGIVVETKGVGVQHIAEQKYKKLWNSTIPKKDLDKYGWDANPWVWVIEFERVEPDV